MPQEIVSTPWDQLPDIPWKDKIAYLVHKMWDLPQMQMPVTHRFEPGRYIREIRIPGQTFFIGKEHRHGHLCELTEGSVVYITEAGKSVVHAPFAVHTTPGTHIVLFTLTPIDARTVHANEAESRDIAALEDDFAVPADELRKAGARVEYKLMVALSGIDEEALRPIFESEADQIPMPGEYPVSIGASDIDKQGVFATRNIDPGEVIAPVRIDEHRTPAGRYANHSFYPNARMISDINRYITLEAIHPIDSGQEVTVDYREALALVSA